MDHVSFRQISAADSVRAPGYTSQLAGHGQHCHPRVHVQIRGGSGRPSFVLFSKYLNSDILYNELAICVSSIQRVTLVAS